MTYAEDSASYKKDWASYKIEIAGEDGSWWASVSELGVENPATWDNGDYETKEEAIEAARELMGVVIDSRFL